MQMDLFKLFCDVVDEQSVSKAAAINGITQSAASQRLISLERDFGIPLLDRSTRPFRLTTAGERYYRGCRQLLDRYRRLRTEVIEGAEEENGHVHVAAIYSAGIDLLKLVQRDFQQAYPGKTVEIHYAQPDEVYRRVRSGRSDLGILSYPQRWSGLASMPLREETMVVVARAGHPLVQRESLEPIDLNGVEMAAFDTSLPISRRVGEYFRQHQSAPLIVQTFDNIDTIKGFIAETDAVAILPARTIQREVSRGVLGLAALKPEFVRPMAIVYSRQTPLSITAEAFADYLLKHQPSEKIASEPPTAKMTA